MHDATKLCINRSQYDKADQIWRILTGYRRYLSKMPDIIGQVRYFGTTVRPKSEEERCGRYSCDEDCAGGGVSASDAAGLAPLQPGLKLFGG